MERITVSQLRDNLDAYLERVRMGERFLVLDRGQPIARLECLEERIRLDDRLARLVSEGLARPAIRPIPNDLIEKPPPGPGDGVREALVEERQKDR